MFHSAIKGHVLPPWEICSTVPWELPFPYRNFTCLKKKKTIYPFNKNKIIPKPTWLSEKFAVLTQSEKVPCMNLYSSGSWEALGFWHMYVKLWNSVKCIPVLTSEDIICVCCKVLWNYAWVRKTALVILKKGKDLLNLWTVNAFKMLKVSSYWLLK